MTIRTRVGALMLALWKKIGKGFTQRRKEEGAGTPKYKQDGHDENIG